MTKKTPPVAKLINEAVQILTECGLPLNSRSARRREKIAMSFLAVAGVSHSAEWRNAGKSIPLTTKQIIKFLNRHFGETLAVGSYDDIKRKDLADPILAKLVVPSANNPDAATNDGTRGYGLAADFASLVRTFGLKDWPTRVAKFMDGRPTLADQIQQKPAEAGVPVTLPGGQVLIFSSGKHNLLQRAIIEEFLPRYGHGAALIYLGDTADKERYKDADLATQLGLTLDPSAKIPDVIAWSAERNWLYLIEAVHSSGPISNQRRIELQAFAAMTKAGLIFVTAFLDIHALRRWSSEIGWETEVWLASDPNHMIHWNGDRFMGPRPARESE